MASILDSALVMAKESTYGTAATLTGTPRAYEVQADTWKKSIEYISSVGFAGGMQTDRAGRRVAIEMGGEGNVQMGWMEQGMLPILQAILGPSVTGPVAGAGSLPAQEWQFASDTDASGVSFTAAFQRAAVDGTLNTFLHTGSVVTGWSLTQAQGEFLQVEFNFDCQDVEKVSNATVGTATYPGSTVNPFVWTQATVKYDDVELGGASGEHDVRSLELNADLMLKTDRRFLAGTHKKKEPIRNGIPSYEGSIEADFTDTEIFDDWVAGDTHKLEFIWTGRPVTGDDTDDYLVHITMPSIQWQGETPEVSTSDVPVQRAPFKLLDNGSDDVMTIDVVEVATTLA